jgi:hypothetical protein
VGGVGFGGSLDHMGHYPIRDSRYINVSNAGVETLQRC